MKFSAGPKGRVHSRTSTAITFDHHGRFIIHSQARSWSLAFGLTSATMVIIGALGWALGAPEQWMKGVLVAGMVGAALVVTASNAMRSLAFTAWVFACIVAAFVFPNLFISWGGFELKTTIGPLVQLIMFGMGMTLTFTDFSRVSRRPVAVFSAAILQYSIMPLGAFVFAWLFHLPPEVAAGLILIGSCPGGTSSNVLTYIARGNVPLSVTMTAFSTIIAPIMTPLMMKLYAGQYVPVEMWPMMISIMKLIIIPVVAGLLINRYLPRFAAWAKQILPAVAMGAICVIIAITIALARDKLLTVGLALFFAAVCHNATGYFLGYWGAKAVGMNRRDARTVAFEVGLQNGGMATGLALGVMHSAVIALGSAVFGPWSAVSSSILASIWRRSESDDPEAVEQHDTNIKSLNPKPEL